MSELAAKRRLCELMEEQVLSRAPKLFIRVQVLKILASLLRTTIQRMVLSSVVL